MVRNRTKLALWWHRGGIGRTLILFLVVSLCVALLVYGRLPQAEDAAIPNGLFVWVSVGLIVALICVLAFVVGRNVVKLIFDRRRNILGSKLRMKLVVAFVGLTLIPTVILFILASGLLSRAMQGWFNSQVEASVAGAVDVGKGHYHMLNEIVQRDARRLAAEIESVGNAAPTPLHTQLERLREENGFFALQVLRADHSSLALAENAAAGVEPFQVPLVSAEAVRQALSGSGVTLPEERGASHFVRSYLPLRLAGQRTVFVVTYRIEPEVAQALAQVNDSYNEYRQLAYLKGPLRAEYILIFSLITGLILFSAVWIGFYIARDLVGPIQKLVEGTTAVARGEYDFQLRVQGDDEIGALVKSFNQMTTDLKRTRGQAEQRRLYIETIVENLAVGVIGVDQRQRITSVNSAAMKIFGFSPSSVEGRSIEEAFGADVTEAISALVSQVEDQERIDPSGAKAAAECEMNVVVQGSELKILCTAGRVQTVEGNSLGMILLFDDITELSKAQHMSAWREVARRIAHEIKNPLTPIQLSAQRLQRIFASLDPSSPVHECAQTIVDHVDSIKRLANEFSHFARMPTAEMAPSDLNALIAETVSPYAESHASIVFRVIADNKMPALLLDREQIRRVIINLLDNAIAAIEGDPVRPEEPGRITLRTYYDRRDRRATLEVEDNGPGIRLQDRQRVFEPYFTTKSGGTGLGLAVVTSIVADHQGTVRLYDNSPRGVKFIVDLPASPKISTQRRFAL